MLRVVPHPSRTNIRQVCLYVIDNKVQIPFPNYTVIFPRQRVYMYTETKNSSFGEIFFILPPERHISPKWLLFGNWNVILAQFSSLCGCYQNDNFRCNNWLKFQRYGTGDRQHSQHITQLYGGCCLEPILYCIDWDFDINYIHNFLWDVTTSHCFTWM